MVLHNRNLWPSSDNYTQTDDSYVSFCLGYCYQYGSCPKECSGVCSDICPSPPHPSKLKKLLIAITLIAALTFFLISCYALYFKYYVIPRRRRRAQQEPRIETQDVFLDEEHGPVIEHHIWYINRVGLEASVISSITVCKYNRGDGLIEGTDCSVCLNEFQEDESLRLLPKCSHAFHVNCIDTWLRSHTNCPLCRAPIIANTAVAAENSIGNASSEEEREVGAAVNGESAREMNEGDASATIEEGGELEALNGTTNEDGILAMRRSVSLDSLSAFKLSQALANAHVVEESGGSSSSQLPRARRSASNMGILAKRGGGTGNQSLIKLMAGSSLGRTLQVGPSSLIRSFSCSGKLFMSRYYRNRNCALPS